MHFLLPWSNKCDLWRFGLIMGSCLRPSYRQALCIDPICISELKLDVFTHILIIQLRFHTSSPFCFGCEYVHLSVCLWSLSPVVSFVLVVAEISRCMLYRFLRFVQANQTIKGSQYLQEQKLSTYAVYLGRTDLPGLSHCWLLKSYSLEFWVAMILHLLKM